MHKSILSLAILGSLALVSCEASKTAAEGTATTVGHAAQGVGRTGATAVKGVAHTVGGTLKTAGTGIAEGDVKKATVGTVKTAGHGTVNTAVDTGRSHVKTTSGVVKDTGTTIKKTSEAAAKEQ